MIGEIPTTAHEQPPDTLITEAVDVRLPPTMEHEPVFDLEGNLKAIKREAQLVEGDPLKQRYLYLKVTSTLEDGANWQYSVRELDRLTWYARTYTWTPGEPVQVTDYGVIREPEEDEIEKLTQRIYDAELYDPQRHKVNFQKRRRKYRGTEYTELVPALGQQPKSLGRIVLDKVLNIFKRR